MVIKFQDYFVRYNESLLDDKGVAINDPKQANTLIKLLEWYRTLYTNKRNSARSDKVKATYQERINDVEGNIASLEMIKNNQKE